MNILITGGAGFIGTSLAEKLCKTNNVVLVDFKDKWKPCHKSYEKYSIDLSNYKNLSSIGQVDFDIVYHLAAQTSGRISMENPEKDLFWNSLSTMNISRFCIENNVKKVVYTSSMAVYGNGENLRESDILAPTSHYGVSKLSGEHYIKRLEYDGIDTFIFRLFNVYGPGQDMENMKQGMVSIFLKQMLNSDTIEVTGSLDRYRDLVYIEDVIDALEMPINVEDIKNTILNVGTGNKTYVKNLISEIVSMDGNRKFTIVNIGSHSGDPQGNYSNIDKIKSYGWNPKVSLRDGIKKFYIHEIKKRDKND